MSASDFLVLLERAAALTIAELLTAILYTLLVCGLCTLLAVPIGTMLSILLVRTNIYGRQLGWIALGSQLALPLYAFAGGWSAGLGWQGWLNPAQWLGGTAVIALQQTWTSVLAVSVLHALAAIPWVALIVGLGLYWSNRSLEELTLLERGGWYVVWRVVLPQLRPWLIASCVWCCLPVMTEMVITNLYQVPTVAEQIYVDASRGTHSGWTYTASIALFLATLLVVLWCSRQLPHSLQNSSGIDAEVRDKLQASAQRTIRFQPLPRRLLSVGVWALLLVLVGLPIINLIAKAGWQPKTDAGGLVSYGWRGERFTTTVQETITLFTAEIAWSLQLSAAASGTAVALALLLSMSRSRWGRRAVGLAMLAMICTPGPLVGMLLIWALNRDNPSILGYLYDRTLLAPVLAQQFRLLPLAWLLVQTFIATVPQRVWELAKIDGLGTRQQLYFVLARHHWTRWLAIVVVLASLSVGELSCTILVLPPGVTTLSMRLFELLHFGMRHQDSGLCGLLLLVGWLVSLLLWKTLNDR